MLMGLPDTLKKGGSRRGGIRTGHKETCTLATAPPDLLCEADPSPSRPAPPPVLKRTGRRPDICYLGRLVVKVSATVASGPCPHADAAAGVLPIAPPRRGRRVTARVWKVKNPGRRAEGSGESPERRSNMAAVIQAGWERARLAWLYTSAANTQDCPHARVFAFREDVKESTRPLANGRINSRP